MGNLIGLRDSLFWTDIEIDRNRFIDNLNDAINEAKKQSDIIYGTPSFSDFTGDWTEFISFIYETMYDDSKRKVKFPWLNQLQHTTLIGILAIFQNTSPNLSNTLKELNEEFPDENNQYVACYYEQIPNGTVHDINSWEAYHLNFVSKFNYPQRCQQFEYFKRFFKPELKIPQNQINQLIDDGRTDPSMIRIDLPLIPHEKIHIHFSNDWALNIDGTWKHLDKTFFKISTRACQELSEWGFLLPDDYYV